MSFTTDPTNSALRFGRVCLDIARRQLLLDGQPAKVGARAFDMLLALVERRDRTVSKDELLEIVWPGLVVEENNLQVHISALRKLLGPQAIATVPGKGYQFTGSLDDPPPATDQVEAPPAAPNNLPQQRTRFIGREKALADCTRLLKDARLLTLTGIGGCGKTRLALQLAQKQLAEFPSGIWFVDLAPLQDAERVVSAVAFALGVQDETGTPLIERVIAHLAQRPVLLVLDNCEHVIEAAVGLIDSLLASCEGLQILVTSREALGVPGEQNFPVRSLSLPTASDFDSMKDSEAVRVFIDRARLALPEFDVTTGNAATIAEICKRLDGIALAIELAAARVKVLSVDEIRARLDDRFRLLTGGSRALPRHQTLQATMQWSYEHLSPEEQRLLRQLAVFAGGWTLAAATQVVGAADEYKVLELLNALHDKSLVVAERENQREPRYRMLETVRQYAQERLNDSGEGEEARTRHLLHFVALTEDAEPQLVEPQQGEVLARLGLDQENLLAAIAWCERASGGAELELRLAGSLWRYWMNSSQLASGDALTRDAVRRAGTSAPPLVRCRGLLAMGQFAFRMGRYDESIRCATEGLALAREAGASKQIMAGLNLLANGLRSTGQANLATTHYEEARDIALAIGDRHMLKVTTHNLAENRCLLGDLAAAESLYEQAMIFHQEFGNTGSKANTACSFARLLIGKGKLDRARELLRDGRSTAEVAGLKSMASELLEVSAGLAAGLGDFTGAVRLHGASLTRRRDTRYQREPLDAAFIEAQMARAREALGAEAYDAAETEGQALGYEASMVELKQWLERSA